MGTSTLMTRGKEAENSWCSIVICSSLISFNTVFSPFFYLFSSFLLPLKNLSPTPSFALSICLDPFFLPFFPPLSIPGILSTSSCYLPSLLIFSSHTISILIFSTTLSLPSPTPPSFSSLFLDFLLIFSLFLSFFPPSPFPFSFHSYIL